MWIVALLWGGVGAPVAHAEDAEGITLTELGDIYPYLPPEGANNWDPQPLVDAIRGSGLTFTPKDVYALIDKEVHPAVTKVVADMAALFYDGKLKSLSQQRIDARKGQPRTSVDLDSSNFVVLFENFNDYENQRIEAEKTLGPLAGRSADESQSVYERRARAWTEQLVKRQGPFEGQAENTTFTVTLAARVDNRDGCDRAVADVLLGQIDFDLFRLGMGVKTLENIIDFQSTSTEMVRFTVEGERRFEAVGRCGTRAGNFKATLHRTFEGSWSGSGGF